ncbi:MAG: tetratricopeptide repeat protein [Alphaproteobacteria bacterium]|jgi:Flp pilus assembly protein TadD|nr:tetratricopeptide repeat protein [Alphaproteobacteria bacterium]
MKTFRMVFTVAALMLAGLAFAPLDGYAASNNDSSTAGKDPNMTKGQAAVDVGDWNEAVRHFTSAVKVDSDNADAHNMLAYSYRRSGQLDPAFEHYGHALAINPRHKGANEYIGEAYLMSGDLAKAEEHLAALKDICGKGCRETRKLTKSIARYKESHDKQALLDDDQNW